ALTKNRYTYLINHSSIRDSASGGTAWPLPWLNWPRRAGLPYSSYTGKAAATKGQPRSPSAELPPTSRNGRGAARANSSWCSCVNVGSLIAGPRYQGASQFEKLVP